MELRDMYDERNKLVARMREILDGAEKEKRDLTAEEQQEYDRLEADVEKRGKEIQAEERKRRLDLISQGLRPADDPIKPVPDDGAADTGVRGTPEYRSAYWKQMRHGKQVLDADEYRALNVGTDAAGGFLVPDEFERTLIDKLSEENIVRILATVVRSSNDRQIPVVAGHGTAYWTAEGGGYTESDDTLEQKLLTAHKLTCLMKASEELVQDSAFDIETYVSREFTRRIGVKEEEAFVAGTGTGQPRGLTLDAETGVTAASATAIAADELIDLFHSLTRPYRNRAVWLMNDATVKAVRKLKDTSNDYLWQPGLQAGQPDRLLGRPVYAASAMPQIGTTNVSIVFGDLSYYWIAQRQGIVFQRLAEKYADVGQVGFRAYERVDGLLVLTEAVKKLVHP